MSIVLSDSRDLPEAQVIALYAANHWSSAEKPAQLMAALRNSHAVVSAWDGDTLVGLGNAISDGHLVVYYPHLLVMPTHHGRGIGAAIMERLKEEYAGFHQHILIADGRAVDFYRKCGFTPAGATRSMWIYEGNDH
jgi:GNAT superfamily N-acetyltransferase